MFFANVLSISLIISVLTQEKTYKNYRIYDVFTNNAADTDLLWKLVENVDYDFFSLPGQYELSTRIMIPPERQEDFEVTLQRAGLKSNLITEDVQYALKVSQIESKEITSSTNVFSRYLRFDEILTCLKKLSAKHPKRISIKTHSKSYEGRALQAVTITNDKNDDTNRKVILIDAGIRAREWISHATALYIIYELLEAYEENTHLLRDYDWIVLPVVNPDGYEYSHTTERMWRKTRKPVARSPCNGTDGNRNYDSHWGAGNSSKNPCSSIYLVESAFSEPETQFVRDIMLQLRGRVKLYISLHSYASCLLYPWGYTTESTRNWRQMYNVAQAGAAAMQAASGTSYCFSKVTDVFAPAGGGSDDYAHDVVNIPISFTMELPAGGTGFDPKPRDIQPMASEAWIGIKAMSEEISVP